ncbi:DUF1778 domain-containing protein [Chlamydiales bacterium]|nr:DUF1778 domain-containing protein [Chlamydiales bacterium]
MSKVFSESEREQIHRAADVVNMDLLQFMRDAVILSASEVVLRQSEIRANNRQKLKELLNSSNCEKSRTPFEL